MLENLHQLSVDDLGNSVTFSKIEEDKLVDVKQLLFSPLLSQEEIEGDLSEIVTSNRPEYYLVVEQDYTKKAYGKWDKLRLRGVGTDMKT
ncbi:hypothetical protein BWQ96_03188 [Gracilariopsis chorda]|uniref:Uncharacterized protein n=1 Tax=Gracilariopsis chorda TaxID=448386 RepID=A0A2V3IXX4_9FLOR|nr:hypothetical protein BWQ96_03188 [Gracilariopsis chorda]|eukprot:PXF46998.1 hypothetical protein BWQ96_03188 [Gracilariopsis chorda]